MHTNLSLDAYKLENKLVQIYHHSLPTFPSQRNVSIMYRNLPMLHNIQITSPYIRFDLLYFRI